LSKQASLPADPPARGPAQLWAVCLLQVLLAVKGDGHFPLPRSLPAVWFQLYILVLTVAFGALLGWLLRAAWGGGTEPQAQGGGGRGTPSRLTPVLLFGCCLADLAVLLLESGRYASFGYRLRPVPALALGLALLLPLALLSLAGRSTTARRVFWAAAASFLAAQALSILAFPLHPERSDMLPLIREAHGRILAGESPYGLYELVPGRQVPLTYLPGLLLAYLPASLLGLDLRLMNLAYSLAAWALAMRQSRGSVAAAGELALFFLGPYAVYRHDLYLAPIYFVLALVWWSLRRGKLSWASIGVAILLSLSQLGWLAAALLGLFFWRRFGGTGLRRLALAAGCVAALLAGPVAAVDGRDFLAGTILNWAQVVRLDSFNLTYWVLAVAPLAAQRALQGSAVALVAGLGWPRVKELDDVFLLAAAATFAFVVLNTLVWTYFLLVVLFLATLGRVGREVGGP
jgi:hypothetical protein